MLIRDIIYWGIPSLALVINLVLFLILVLSKKDSHIRSFMLFVLSMTAWAATSLFMKLQMQPGVLFWNRMMVSSITLVPYFAYIFISNFTGQIKKTAIAFWTLVIITMNVLNAMGFMITSADMVPVIINGTTTFELQYSLGIPAYFAFGTIFILLSVCMLMMRKAIRYGNKSSNRLKPVLTGLFILYVGFAINLLPAIGKYPVDFAFGIVTSFYMMFAVYKTRVIELKFVITRAVVFTGLLTLLVTITVFIVNQIMSTFGNFMSGMSREGQILVSTLVSILMFLPLFNIVQRLVENYFYKVENQHNNLIKLFTMTVSNNLNLENITDELLKVVHEITNNDRAFVFLKNDETEDYDYYASIKKLDKLSFNIQKTHPFVRWFKQFDDIIYEQYVDVHPFFKTMWDNERQELILMRFEAAIPLKYNGTLTGILLISSKDSTSRLAETELNHVATLCATAAITISNASMYEKTKREAIMDSLTNVYNRRYFMEQIAKHTTNLRNQTVSLIILNIDMFSVFNDLYGHYAGDHALIKIADAIKFVCGSQGIICRFGEDTFAIILPYVDSKGAYELSEKIRLRITNQTMAQSEDSNRFVTISAGICVAPTLAFDEKDIVAKANLALHAAKINGKNQSLIYNPDQHDARHNGDEEMNMATIYALTAAIDAKDHYTFGHSQRVARYAVTIAEEAGASKDEVELIRQASLLHDIGKIGIPENILTKYTKLTDEEYETMKKHVDMSITIIKYLPSFSHVIPAVIGHHERWDGTGYPRKISGENIPFAARCIAIADAFDAITSDRHYKSYLSVDYAVDEIERYAGKQFDPKLASIFVKLVRSGKLIIEPSRANNYPTIIQSPNIKA